METIINKIQLEDNIGEAERKYITDALAEAIEINKKNPEVSPWDSNEYRKKYGI